MKFEWKIETLADVCKVVTDGSHYSPHSVQKGKYMVSVKDFTEYGFDFSQCRQISKQDYEKLQKVIAEHITTKAQGFKELSPMEYDQIQDYRVMKKGQYVLMVISDNPSAIEQEFLSILSGK